MLSSFLCFSSPNVEEKERDENFLNKLVGRHIMISMRNIPISVLLNVTFLQSYKIYCYPKVIKQTHNFATRE